MPCLARALGQSRRRLREELTVVQRSLAVAGTVSHRRKHPSLARLLAACELMSLT